MDRIISNEPFYQSSVIVGQQCLDIGEADRLDLSGKAETRIHWKDAVLD